MISCRRGTQDDLGIVCAMIEAAKERMRSQGIDQWDGSYPAREDFERDISEKTLYIAQEDGEPAAVYVISEECEPEYLECRWEYEKACVLHRFCVSPDRQGRGIGKQVLKKIEDQLSGMGYGSVRLDVFSENPHAVRLYEKSGYVRRGHADWRKGRFWLMEKKLP